jgi:hypothetical protein
MWHFPVRIAAAMGAPQFGGDVVLQSRQTACLFDLKLCSEETHWKRTAARKEVIAFLASLATGH